MKFKSLLKLVNPQAKLISKAEVVKLKFVEHQLVMLRLLRLLGLYGSTLHDLSENANTIPIGHSLKIIKVWSTS